MNNEIFEVQKMIFAEIEKMFVREIGKIEKPSKVELDGLNLVRDINKTLSKGLDGITLAEFRILNDRVSDLKARVDLLSKINSN